MFYFQGNRNYLILHFEINQKPPFLLSLWRRRNCLVNLISSCNKNFWWTISEKIKNRESVISKGMLITKLVILFPSHLMYWQVPLFPTRIVIIIEQQHRSSVLFEKIANCRSPIAELFANNRHCCRYPASVTKTETLIFSYISFCKVDERGSH